MSFLPEKDREYLESKGITYEEHTQGSQRAVILKGYSLPQARYDADAADVLILLPPGYPDTPPDMFYTLPWLKVAPAGRYARAADQPFNFNGERWQRWSRHNREWRPGADGIWTMTKRVEHALAIAA